MIIKMQAKTAQEKRISRWYFGGLASSGAAMVTHPLDLLKVLQIQSQLWTNMYSYPPF